MWPADSFEAIFSEGRAEFRRRDQGIDAYTEVVVSPEDDIELRRLRLTNRSRSRRSIEFTTYTEVVMAPAAADAVHPAFSKLFVQTEVLDQPALILCSRRPRSAEEQPPWMFHLVAVHARRVGPASHETDRVALHRPWPRPARAGRDARCSAAVGQRPGRFSTRSRRPGA